MATYENVVSGYEELPEDDKQRFRNNLLPEPSGSVANVLWIMTFAVLAVVIIGGGILAIRASGSDETALYGFVGIALGAFAGMLVPSPIKT